MKKVVKTKKNTRYKEIIYLYVFKNAIIYIIDSHKIFLYFRL